MDCALEAESKSSRLLLTRGNPVPSSDGTMGSTPGARICHLGPPCFLAQPHTPYRLSKPPLLRGFLSTWCVAFVSSTTLKLPYLIIEHVLIDGFPR